MDRLDREFNLLAASVKRTARVQQEEVERFLEAAPRRRIAVASDQTPEQAVGEPGQENREVADSDQNPRCGAVLAKHLHAAYSALIAHVDQRRVDYETLPDPESKRGAVTEMRQLVAGARNLHTSLSWLDAAREPPLDLGTRYLVEEITASLVSPNAEVTTVAAIDRSYATVTNPLGPVFQLSGAALPGGEIATVIFVPRREQRSGLLHPLIIHELGHAAEAQHRLVGQVIRGAAEKANLIVALGKAAKEYAELPGGGDMAAAIETLWTRLAAWTEEAVCDAFAAQLLGPTYLYAFMTIVGTSDLDAAGEKHPPTRQRIRLLLAQLDGLGWQDLLVDASSEIDSWFRATAAMSHDYADVAARFCVEALEAIASEIREVVASHLGTRAFRAESFTPVCDEVAELLGAGVPPSQTLARVPVDRAAIILGSWLFAVKESGGDLDALPVAADVPQLARLLPKALQDVALLEVWGDAA